MMFRVEHPIYQYTDIMGSGLASRASYFGLMDHLVASCACNSSWNMNLELTLCCCSMLLMIELSLVFPFIHFRRHSIINMQFG